jgi:tetratricopeptide (TPR) repeat protein
VRWQVPLVVVLVLAWCGRASAGLYDPTQPPIVPREDPQEFLTRQLADLRGLGPPDALLGGQASAAREEALARIQELRQRGPATAAEFAALGALLLRVRRSGPQAQDFEEAVAVLEQARRTFPRDFYVLANLASAYQLTGRLDAAASLLQEALEYAPAEHREMEGYHLRLVRQRAREQYRLGLAPLDELFVGPDRQALRYVGPSGSWEIGRLADSEKAKLPRGSVAEAMRVVQQLLLWFPDDGRLLWQYGELANAAGDWKTAAAALGQAVYTFRLSTPELKERRFWLLEAVAWREVLARAGQEPEQAVWLAQLVPGSLPLAAVPDPTAWVLAQGLRLPQPKDPLAGGLFLGGASPGDEAEELPPADWLATIGWSGWMVLATAAVLVLGLFLLQVREWRRRGLSLGGGRWHRSA